MEEILREDLEEKNAFAKLLEDRNDEFNNIPVLYFENDLDAETYEEEIIKVDEINDMFVRKVDLKTYHKIEKKYNRKFTREIENDETGDGFIFDYLDENLSHAYNLNLLADMRNKERKINIETIDDAISFLKIDKDLFLNDERFYHGLEKALERHLKHTKDYMKGRN